MTMFSSEAYGKHKPQPITLKPKKKKGGDGVIIPKPWQQEAREKQHGKRFTLTQAPCGAGKTVADLLRAVDEIVDSDFAQKQLVVVPQRVIGFNFAKEVKFKDLKTAKIWTWLPAHSFVQKSKDVLDSLEAWLLSSSKKLCGAKIDPAKIDGVNAVCSHQALALVFDRLSAKERNQAFHKLTVSIDECHHVKGVFDENDEKLTSQENEESNNLGRIAHYIVNSKDKTSRLHLGTATFYRGDGQDILHESVSELFTAGTYVRSMADHWPDLNLEKFRTEHRCYSDDGDVIEQAVRVIEQKPKHIYMCFLPRTDSAWRDEQGAKRLFKRLCKLIPEENVLDLVTRKAQKVNTQKLVSDYEGIKAGKAPQFRVIVSCGIGLEGLDHPPCDRLLNLAVQNSVTERWSIPVSWVRDQCRSRSTDPIPHVRLGRYVRFSWGSPELNEWWLRRQSATKRVT